MRRRTLLRVAAGLFALAACAAAAAPRAPLTVFAAASLKESLDAAAAAYERETGTPVRVSYAASSALARQIEQRAPADVFVSADLEWMDWLQRRALVDATTRRDLLGNTLVLVAPAASRTRPVTLSRGVDLSRVLGPDGRLALALTASVPAGKYARAALESLGAWSAVQPRVVEGENVRAALLLVARGEAALGAVYATDARAEPRVRVVATFPAGSHPPIVYPAARVAASTHPDAAAFVRWLRGPTARALFVARGFRPLG
ncbi:molybdate ABC transporter substrate-binding protein [Tolypothrix campylonemoides VB511288]|nr:molybdate ABC transporter substrate-binding protein [Tolypothrix campylonemoides VB511288]